ncbi:MAG TPA: helix-turn-helix transcriptional regulator [Thermogutta sp.]|nr:helix-turn-helix transcriptional regulator [Thermogutta sp.]
MDENNVFASRLRKLRKEVGLSQEEFAKRLGFSIDAVGSWERGIRNPASRALGRIAQYFGVDPRYLTGETANRYERPDETLAVWLDDQRGNDERYATMMSELSDAGKLRVYQTIVSTHFADEESGELRDPGYVMSAKDKNA